MPGRERIHDIHADRDFYAALYERDKERLRAQHQQMMDRLDGYVERMRDLFKTLDTAALELDEIASEIDYTVNGSPDG